MRKFIVKIGLLAMISGSSCIAAGASEIFNVAVLGAELEITTNVPGHIYPNAGIKVNTPGYTVKTGVNPRKLTPENTYIGDGFLQFTASATENSLVTVSGPSKAYVNVTICLNAIGALSCQSKTFWFVGDF